MYRAIDYIIIITCIPQSSLIYDNVIIVPILMWRELTSHNNNIKALYLTVSSVLIEFVTKL